MIRLSHRRLPALALAPLLVVVLSSCSEPTAEADAGTLSGAAAARKDGGAAVSDRASRWRAESESTSTDTLANSRDCRMGVMIPDQS